jgi:tetratricopeptide (TPR) repeat protein
MLAARRLSYGALAATWARRATAYFALGNYRQAIADNDRAISWGGRFPAAYLNRGVAYLRLGDGSHALADITLAAGLAPNNPAIQNNLCWVIARTGGDLDRARAACDRALQLSPQLHMAFDSRAFVFLRQNRFQEAWNDYDTALRVAPSDAHHLYGRGIAALRLGRQAEARDDMARAVQAQAGIAHTYADYGVTP